MISILIAVFVILADQFTKLLAVGLKGNDPFVIIKGVLRFSYVENRGAAFGMLSENRAVFMIASVLIISLLCYIIFKFRGQNKLFDICLGLLLGGGVGNMIDRVRIGYVIDFIDFYAFDFWKYVFNVADCAVVIGCFFAIVCVFIDQKMAKENAGGLLENMQEANDDVNDDVNEFGLDESGSENADNE